MVVVFGLLVCWIDRLMCDGSIQFDPDPQPVPTPTPMRTEPKKEQRFSKDGHFYAGAIGIGTYSWGDRRDGFFYGDVRITSSRGFGAWGCGYRGVRTLIEKNVEASHSYVPTRNDSTRPIRWSGSS